MNQSSTGTAVQGIPKRTRGAKKMDKDLRRRIHARFNHECTDCSSANRLEVHRVVAGKDGGRYSVENCVLVCRPCHRERHGWQI